MTHPSADTFDALFEADEDPWKFRTRWYEARKRALTLAGLPQQRYRLGYEPGCANGELSAALADRCDRLVVSDGSAKAVTLARARLGNLAHVDVRQAWLPDQWPSDPFDLVVVSELGYFLPKRDMATLAARLGDAVKSGATVLACHWRHPAADCEVQGDEVHRLVAEAMPHPSIATYLDADFRVDVWCADTRSVAQREGIT